MLRYESMPTLEYRQNWASRQVRGDRFERDPKRRSRRHHAREADRQDYSPRKRCPIESKVLAYKWLRPAANRPLLRKECPARQLAGRWWGQAELRAYNWRSRHRFRRD